MRLNDLKLYKGKAKPLNFYAGRNKITGWHEETKTGESVEFIDTYNDKAVVTISGKSGQAVTATGKNILGSEDLADRVIALAGDSSLAYKATVDGRSVLAWKGSSSYNGRALALPFAFKPNTIYSFSFTAKRQDAAGQGGKLAFYYTDGTRFETDVSSGEWTSRIQTSAAGKTLASVKLTFGSSGYTTYFDYDTIQLEEGAATAYEPFVPNSPSPDYPSPVLSAGNCDLTVTDGIRSTQFAIPILRKVGEIADAYDPVTGELTRRIGTILFDGSADESWANETNVLTDTVRHIISVPDGLYIDSTANVSTLCDRFKAVATTFGQDRECVGWYQRTILLRLSKSRMTGYSDGLTETEKTALFRNWLSANPITCLYFLNSPLVTMLAPAAVPTYPKQTRLATDGAVKADLSVTAKIADS